MKFSIKIYPHNGRESQKLYVACGEKLFCNEKMDLIHFSTKQFVVQMPLVNVSIVKIQTDPRTADLEIMQFTS